MKSELAVYEARRENLEARGDGDNERRDKDEPLEGMHNS